jgi:hypothetical protein
MTKYPFEEKDQAELDAYLAGVMGDFLAKCEEKERAAHLAVISNGRAFKVKREGNVLWFPVQPKLKK